MQSSGLGSDSPTGFWPSPFIPSPLLQNSGVLLGPHHYFNHLLFCEQFNLYTIYLIPPAMCFVISKFVLCFHFFSLVWPTLLFLLGLLCPIDFVLFRFASCQYRQKSFCFDIFFPYSFSPFTPSPAQFFCRITSDEKLYRVY